MALSLSPVALINGLRFLIIGAPFTIYYNSIFLFDAQLPANYPESPPAVTMHAFGHRVNPNLYDSGYVCCTYFPSAQNAFATSDSC